MVYSGTAGWILAGLGILTDRYRRLASV